MAEIGTTGVPWDRASGRLRGQTEAEEAPGIWRSLRSGFRKKRALWGPCLGQGDRGDRGAIAVWSRALDGEVAGALPGGREAGGSRNARSRGRRHGPPWDEGSVLGRMRPRRPPPPPPSARFQIPSPALSSARPRGRGWRIWRGPRTRAGVDRQPPPVHRGRSRRAAAAATSTGAQPRSHTGPLGPSADPRPLPPQLTLRHGLAAR